MAGAKEIRSKIASIKNTQKITKAMEMVAASKMRKAQDRMRAARPYAEKIRKARYDLDEDQLKPYFELDNVLKNGVFYAANRLYGLTFKERKDIPVWQPGVRVFEVTDANGNALDRKSVV